MSIFKTFFFFCWLYNNKTECNFAPCAHIRPIFYPVHVKRLKTIIIAFIKLSFLYSEFGIRLLHMQCCIASLNYLLKQEWKKGIKGEKRTRVHIKTIRDFVQQFPELRFIFEYYPNDPYTVSILNILRSPDQYIDVCITLSQGNIFISHVEFMAVSGQMGFFFPLQLCNRKGLCRTFKRNSIECSIATFQILHNHTRKDPFECFVHSSRNVPKISSYNLILSQRLKSVRRLPEDFRKFFIWLLRWASVNCSLYF